MSAVYESIRTMMPFFVLLSFLTVTDGRVMAQDVIGASIGYEIFPFASLADPADDVADLEIQTSSRSAGAAFPVVLAEGKIVLLNKFNYNRVDFYYRNLPGDEIDIDQGQSMEYTAFLIDSLSPKWKMVAVLTPGYASDFESKLSSDDFTFQGAFGFIRQFRRNFSFGFGAAYIRDFGTPLPLPFLYFDWEKSDKFSINGIVPNNLDVSYIYNPKLDLGISFKVGGNRYHGNPGKFFDDQGNPIRNPQMEYSEGTISPVARIHFLEWLHLDIEGGFAFYRNFEFLDGDDVKSSLDLERTTYLRAGLVLGS